MATPCSEKAMGTIGKFHLDFKVLQWFGGNDTFHKILLQRFNLF